MRLTRAALESGALLAEARRRAPPGMRILTEAELAESLARTLEGQDPTADVWVFAYGSLIWNPLIEHAGQCLATVRGWHRRFCLGLTMGRGSPERPGLMLALDRGGACRGVAYRLPAGQARRELTLLWRREMLTGAYLPRWISAEAEGTRRRVLTFVANRADPRYVGALPEAEVVRRLATGSGELGSCRAYLERTVAALRELGIRDPTMERLHREVRALLPAWPGQAGETAEAG